MTYEQRKYTLELENLIISKQFVVAKASYELAKYGEWQCDYIGEMAVLDSDITRLLGFMAQYL